MKKFLMVSVIFFGLLQADCVRDNQKNIIACNNKFMGLLVWQDIRSFDKMNFDKAKIYCSTLNLAGHKDWRLPSIEELLSITDLSRYEPSIKIAFENVKSDLHWSSTSFASDSSNAWVVDFEYGVALSFDKSYSVFVRCVR